MSDVTDPLNGYWDKSCPYAFVARVPLDEYIMQNVSVNQAPAQRNIGAIGKDSQPDNGAGGGKKAVNIELVGIEIALGVHQLIEVVSIS